MATEKILTVSLINARECASATVSNPTPDQQWQKAQALALVAIAELLTAHETE